MQDSLPPRSDYMKSIKVAQINGAIACTVFFTTCAAIGLLRSIIVIILVTRQTKGESCVDISIIADE
jgi:hypothetical protein